MGQKEKIIAAIRTLGMILAEHQVSWLIGGSGSLLLQGVGVVPNDIDLVVDPKDLLESKLILKDLLINKTEPDINTKKAPFRVNGVIGELLAYKIDRNSLSTVNLGGVTVFVHKLQVELEYYKQRTDNPEQNLKKIKLIEKTLLGFKP